nr:RHS repeat-associated core domain-containing protein [Gemmatimonadales bacterium]
RNAFGKLEGATTGGSTNTEVGFTGASTPNQTGGFTYLRNRWYDPQTGRFLTQDPIGLAGGVNLYAYAGNNPVSCSRILSVCVQRGVVEIQPRLRFVHLLPISLLTDSWALSTYGFELVARRRDWGRLEEVFLARVTTSRQTTVRSLQ